MKRARLFFRCVLPSILTFLLVASTSFSTAQEPALDLDFTLSPDDEASNVDLPLILNSDEEIPTPEPNEGKSDDATAQKSELPIDEEEMKSLSNDPLFKEFSAAVGDVAPLPESVDLNALNVPGALLLDSAAQASTAESKKTVERSQLDEALEIADVDLNALALEPSVLTTLKQLDAEIERLTPLWIDAEINQTVVGRRERSWRLNEQDRFSTDEPAPIDAEGDDWALALDAPFFFQVTEISSGQVYYTKAGDFEPTDVWGVVALTRGDLRYSLATDTNVAHISGRAARVRIAKNGQIQGVDVADKLVVDGNMGSILLFSFENPSRLSSDDGVFFTPTDRSGAPRLAKLPPTSKIGVSQRKLILSNGRADDIFERIVALCKSKKRLIEIATQPRVK